MMIKRLLFVFFVCALSFLTARPSGEGQDTNESRRYSFSKHMDMARRRTRIVASLAVLTGFGKPLNGCTMWLTWKNTATHQLLEINEKCEEVQDEKDQDRLKRLHYDTRDTKPWFARSREFRDLTLERIQRMGKELDEK